MTDPASATQAGFARLRVFWQQVRHHGPSQLQFWVIALILGIAAGYATIGFRLSISFLQELIYGADDVTLASAAAQLHWIWIVTIPVLGGLAVGILLSRFTPDCRVRSVAHVIEGAAVGEGRVEKKVARVSALASLITLSTGGSTGREGPVVHLGAAISTAISDWLRVDGVTARDLMGCAVASAVAASFNAPLAGCIFALEVVLRHFAFHAFAPIAIASVAGAVVGRLHLGDGPEFVIPDQMLSFYVELPAFMILGLLSGFVAVVMMKSIFLAEDTASWVQERLRIPHFLRPAIAGLFLGLIATQFPHIIGVGYETTYLALNGRIALGAAVVFAVVKVIAVSITVGGRMGGGVFSPALMLGALTGIAFGSVATGIFPDFSGAQTVYALAGMAAVAAAVMGGPISTTLIAFELTGDWQIGIAVLVSVSLATIVSSRMVAKSFFLTQIERRGVHIAEGPQAYLLGTISVGRIMRRDDGPAPEAVADMIAQGAFVEVDATLEAVLPRLDAADDAALPVVSADRRYLGMLHHGDAWKAYAEAMAATAREEHA